MKILSRSAIHYAPGKIADAGDVVDLKYDDAKALIAGGYADAYTDPKPAIKATGKAEKAAAAADAKSDETL